jgi:hypothetical protein
MRPLTPWLVLLALPPLACDPVHADEVAALGGEAPGVPRGPLHRPGQPCLVCHAGRFSVAGTVFVDATDRSPAVGAEVRLTDSQGNAYSAHTNEAGNFYVQPGQFTPVYPMKVAVAWSGVTVNMTADVGREGSCAKCHSDPPGPSSAGHVYIPADGGTP